MTAYLVVRAEVPAEERAAFDAWYEGEHLPDAKAAFAAEAAFRGWVDEAAGLHVAFYRFADAETARAVLVSDGMARMIAEFDRVWQNRVVRKREIVPVLQQLS